MCGVVILDLSPLYPLPPIPLSPLYPCPQIDEEEYLSAELKKIDIRKKEREKKTRDLQKMISAADVAEPKKMTSDRGRKVAGSGTTGPFGRQTTAPRGVGRPSTTGVGRPPNQSAGQAAGIKAIAAMRKNSNSGGGGGPNAPRGSRFKKVCTHSTGVQRGAGFF